MLARGPKHNIAVPANRAEVRSFLDGCRARFVQEFDKTRKLVEELRAENPMLRCIYKIYSRGASQGGDELKSSRKVRLKFDEYNITAGNRTASLYDVPDIIGLTIVVAYPSDINVVGPSGRRRRVRAPGTAAGAPSCRRALFQPRLFPCGQDSIARGEKRGVAREMRRISHTGQEPLRGIGPAALRRRDRQDRDGSSP